MLRYNNPKEYEGLSRITMFQCRNGKVQQEYVGKDIIKHDYLFQCRNGKVQQQ